MKNLLTFIFALALCWPAVAQTKSVVTPLATTSTDNGLLRYDGTTGQLVQAATGMTYSDNRALTIGGATITASEPILDLSQTWNNGAVTFTGLKYNVTPTAADAASKTFVTQHTGTNMFTLDKWGGIGTGVYASSFWDEDPWAGWAHESTEGTGAGFFSISAQVHAAAPSTDYSSVDMTVEPQRAYVQTYSEADSFFIATTPFGNVGLTSATNNVGLSIAGATRTTSTVPAIDVLETWNNGAVTFTGLKYNVTDTASAAGSLLMDLQVGGSSRVSVDKTGALTAVRLWVNSANQRGVGYTSNVPTFQYNNIDYGYWANNGLSVRSDAAFNFLSGTAMSAAADIELRRDAAATLQMGADAATATAQSLKAHDGSGTDKDGANITFSGGKSTGTGRGGSVIISTSLTSTTGSSANSYSTREYHNAKPVDLTESAATTIVTVAVAAGEYVSFDMYSTIFASDGTDHQALPTRLNVSAVNKAGTVDAKITAIDGLTAGAVGTLTCTYTAAASGNNVIVQANAVSSLTQTVLRSKWSINALNGNGTASVVVP